MMNSIQDIQSQLLNMAQDPVLVKILLGLTLAGFSCSLLSSFVVVKRMVLAGTAIASSAFVGAVVGMICLPSLTFSDWPILASAAGGSVFIAVVVLFLNRSAVPSTDAVLGVFILGVFAALMISTVEWGIPIPDLTVYLFEIGRASCRERV